MRFYEIVYTITMELPDDGLGLIREFSKPRCRLDWRRGSRVVREPDFAFELITACIAWKQHHLNNEDYLIFIVEALDAWY